MIRKRRKGFTLVELVIVIAVIAILAAVLIPTFTTVINKANLSADQQAAANMTTSIQLSANLGQATDMEGNQLYYDGTTTPLNLNEVEGVVQFFKQNGYNLVPKSKGTSYWYDRTNAVVKIVKDSDAFSGEVLTESVVSGNRLNANVVLGKTYTQDCPEALLSNNTSFIFIDQDPNNAVKQAIDAIYNLGSQTSVDNMQTALDDILNSSALAKVIKSDGDTSGAWAQLHKYNPTDTLFFYGTTDADCKCMTGTGTSKKNVIISKNCTTITATAISADVTYDFKDGNTHYEINIPSNVTLAENSLKKVEGAQYVLNTNYSDLAMSQIFNFNSTTFTYTDGNNVSITRRYLPATATFGTNNQYSYLHYTSVSNGADPATYAWANNGVNYTSANTTWGNVASLNTAPTVATDNLKIQNSSYVIPSVAYSEIAWAADTGLLSDFEIMPTSKNLGNLTVIGGYVKYNNQIYMFTDTAYVKYLTYSFASDGSNKILYISDPLRGAGESAYSNLNGFTLTAHFGDTDTTGTVMAHGQSIWANDYQVQYGNAAPTYVEMKVGDKVICTQYIH